MFKVFKVTDRQGNPSKGVGADAVGGTLQYFSTFEDIVRAPRLLISHNCGYIQTSAIEEVRVQEALFGSPTVEVYTRNSIYYLGYEGLVEINGSN